MRKGFLKKIGKGIAAGAAVVAATATNAMAEPAFIDLSSFEVDTATVGTMGGIVLSGLGLMWGLRKLIKTINRS